MCRCRSCFRSATAQAEKTLADGSALWRKPKAQVTQGGIRRVLRPRQRPVRRAGADRPLPRRGPERIFGAALRAVDEAVRPVRSGAQGPHQALRPARVHHRRGARSCRPGCASCAASSIRRTCRSTCRARCCRPIRSWTRSARRSPPHPHRTRQARRATTRRRFEKVWDAFGAVIKEGLYEDAERRDALYKIARFKTTDRRRDVAEPRRLRRRRCGRTRRRSTMRSARARRRSSPARNSKASPGAASRCWCSPTRSTRSGCARRSATTASRSSR